MTVAPAAPPLVCDTLADAVEALRERGLRISTARRLVLEALYATATPVSAPQLARDLGLEESSVYRNLESLERHGMVRHVHLGHGPGLYVRAGHDEAEYLFCERCEKVVAVPPRELDAVRRQISRQFGHHARFTHFAIVGLCERCAAEAE
ncbi:MAG: Fur family transcriptional regulator [Solirubrobacteraceae bacterium]